MKNLKELFRFLIPSISTNVCIFLFGIIDGIFVGNGVGTNALGAINIVWPFVMIAYALNVLTSFGGTTLLAIAIGKKDYNLGNKYFNDSLVLTIVISSIICILGTFFTYPISIFLGATKDYISYVSDYLFWYCIFLIPNSIGICLEHFCRNDNDPNLVLFSTIFSTVINIFLDYLLIFPIPLGVAGAAIATGISQVIRLIIISIHFIRKKGILRLRLVFPKFNRIKEIFFQGTPEMLAQFDSPVTTFCMNQMLIRTIGNIGINSYSVICYVASFTLSIMYGCSEGAQPLFGQSYGAQKFKKLKSYLVDSIIISLIGSSVCLLIIIYLTKDICHLYDINQKTTQYVQVVLPQYSWAFVVAGVNALISTLLYSIKNTFDSILFNISRSFLFNSLCIFLLPLIIGADIIWYTKGISEILVLILGIFLIKRIKFSF